MRGRDERGVGGNDSDLGPRTSNRPVNNPPEPTNPAETGRFFSSLERHVKCFDFHGDGERMDTGVAGSGSTALDSNRWTG